MWVSDFILAQEGYWVSMMLLKQNFEIIQILKCSEIIIIIFLIQFNLYVNVYVEI